MGTGKMTRPQRSLRMGGGKRARGTEGLWHPSGKRARGTEGAWDPRGKKWGRDGLMGEHKVWKRNNGERMDKSSQDGRAIKWGRIVKREQEDDANKWDRIFKRNAAADSQEVLEMVAKKAEEGEEDNNYSLYYSEQV